MQATKIDNQDIQYKDVVFYSANGCNFNLWDRIKFLFGMKFTIRIEIYTNNERVDVVNTKTTIYVPPLFTKKNKGGLAESEYITSADKK